jgi:ketosteroid isomerase-like protein
MRPELSRWLSSGPRWLRKEVAVAVIDDETRQMFESVYRAFNERDVDAVLVRMSHDVEWPNGWKGGYVHGHEGVREYWSRQWAQLDPTVTPLSFGALQDGRVDVTVRQVVRDRSGVVLTDSTVHHIYRLEGGQIVHMEIGV